MCNNENMRLIDALIAVANPVFTLGVIEEEQLRYAKGSLEHQQLQVRINELEDSIHKEKEYYEFKETQNQIVSLLKQIQGLWNREEILNIALNRNTLSCFAIKAEADRSKPLTNKDFIIDVSEVLK